MQLFFCYLEICNIFLVVKQLYFIGFPYYVHGVFCLFICVFAVCYMFRISSVRFVVTYCMDVFFISYIECSTSLAYITFGSVQTV